jgi:N-acetylglucosaminyldiphosphoundecaprenol N-acetyl-beta-D-mannosaminyltransferase
MLLKFCNIPFLNLPYKAGVKKFITEKKKTHAIFINPHSLLSLIKSKKKILLLKKNNFIFFDGIGIKFILKFFLKKIYRTPGHVFFLELIRQLSEKNKKVRLFIFGSSILNCERFQKEISEIYHNVKVIGFISPPIFNQKLPDSLNDKFVKQINKSKSDLLIVSLTAPKQEMWVLQNFKKIKINKILSLGAVVDYVASNKLGLVKVFSQVGLEWLFRFINNPKAIFIRIFYSFPLLIIYIFRNRKIVFDNFRVDKNSVLKNKTELNEIINKKNFFIISALNLNNLSKIIAGIIDVKNHYYWIDGVIASRMFKLPKVPGYKILSHINLSSKIKSILVIGNLNEKNKIYLKKFYKKIYHYPISYITIEDCYQININFTFSKNQLIFLTLPTPKQEIIANQIACQNKYAKIICIGGGLNIASQFELRPPAFITKYDFEWMWRLRTDFLRRFLRLINSYIIYILGNEKIK